MLTRVLTRTLLGLGTLLGALAVLAAPVVALAGVTFGVLVGATGLLWVRSVASDDARGTALAARRTGLLVGAGATAGWMVLTGVVVLLGTASIPVLLLLVGFTLATWWLRRSRSAAAVPPLRAALGRLERPAAGTDLPRPVAPGRGPQPRRGPTAGAPPPPSGPDPATLSMRELCLAWQRTYFALLDLRAGSPRNELVALRGRLLDELERRDPRGFTRWLDTDARASSNPGRYLTGDR